MASVRTNDRQKLPSTPPHYGLSTWAVLAVLSAFLVGAIVLGYLGWTRDDASVPTSGYVAMAFGVIFSLFVGIGLMALIFYSSRKGYDEFAVLVIEPALHEDEIVKGATKIEAAPATQQQITPTHSI